MDSMLKCRYELCQDNDRNEIGCNNKLLNCQYYNEKLLIRVSALINIYYSQFLRHCIIIKEIKISKFDSDNFIYIDRQCSDVKYQDFDCQKYLKTCKTDRYNCEHNNVIILEELNYFLNKGQIQLAKMNVYYQIFQKLHQVHVKIKLIMIMLLHHLIRMGNIFIRIQTKRNWLYTQKLTVKQQIVLDYLIILYINIVLVILKIKLLLLVELELVLIIQQLLIMLLVNHIQKVVLQMEMDVFFLQLHVLVLKQIYKLVLNLKVAMGKIDVIGDCITKICSHIKEGTNCATCNEGMKPLSSKENFNPTPQCIFDGNKCVENNKLCEQFIGNEITCQTFIAIDGPSKSTNVNLCIKRVCNEALSTYTTDEECQQYHPECYNTGQVCTSNKSCSSLINQNQCISRKECSWISQCYQQSNTCSTYSKTSYTECVNSRQIDGTLCFWTESSQECHTQKCKDLPEKYSTYEQSQEFSSQFVTT